MANSGDTAVGEPSKSPAWQLGLVGIIFFLSGVAALICEISWSRQIGLLFGHTIHAASVVLASYFAGMAVGYWVGARWASRLAPLRGYAVAECVVAGWTCLIPFLLQLAESTILSTWLCSASFQWQVGARAFFCFLLLLPATIALGASLPFMAEFLSSWRNLDDDSKRFRRVSLAYACNTLGALVGVLVATFYLLANVGVQASSFVAAALSAFCGVIAWGMSGHADSDKAREGVARKDEPKEDEISKVTLSKPQLSSDSLEQPGWPMMWGGALAALSGWGTLALEVLYLRMFSLVFHNSTYTFGAVLAIFLLALALGAMGTSWCQRYWRSEVLFAVLCSVGALAVLFSVIIFVRWTELNYFTCGKSFTSYLGGAFALVAVVVLPPVVCLGALLPLVWKLVGVQQGQAGSTVGRLTSLNTLAAAAGSIMASFFMLPFFDLWPSFVLIAILFLFASLVCLWKVRFYRFAIGNVGIFVLLAVAVWNGPQQSQQGAQKEEILQRWQSPYGWIDLIRMKKGGAKKVSQNLHYRYGSTGGSLMREYRQTHLPLLLHSNPRNVLFLGLGTGLTAAGAIFHDELEEIVIVELIPEVVDAVKLLAKENKNIVDHRKSTVHVDDGRHFLMAHDQRFDVIISDLFVPWESETGYLYTVEHYQMARQRLTERGIFCQWLPLYQMGPREWELIADSFATVFPNTTVWWGQMHSGYPIAALIGSEEALQIDDATLSKRLEKLREVSEQSDSLLASSATFLDEYVGDWVPRHPGRLNTDEFPRVEFQTPISHRDRKLLRSDVLLKYFDEILVKLPTAGVSFQASDVSTLPKDARTRHAWQRLILFGDTSQTKTTK